MANWECVDHIRSDHTHCVGAFRFQHVSQPFVFKSGIFIDLETLETLSIQG